MLRRFILSSVSADHHQLPSSGSALFHSTTTWLSGKVDYYEILGVQPDASAATVKKYPSQLESHGSLCLGLTQVGISIPFRKPTIQTTTATIPRLRAVSSRYPKPMPSWGTLRSANATTGTTNVSPLLPQPVFVAARTPQAPPHLDLGLPAG